MKILNAKSRLFIVETRERRNDFIKGIDYPIEIDIVKYLEISGNFEI